MAEDIQSNIRINVDTAAALANIKNLQGSLSAFYSQMAKSGAAANATVSGMQQNFINSVNMSGKFAASIQTIKSSTESFNTALEKNKFSLGEYFKYGVAASKSFGKTFKTEYETINKVAIERVKDLQTQYIKMGRDANGALRSIAIRPLALDLENLGTKTQIAAQRQQILNQLLKQGSTNLLNWGKNTQWAGRQLMVGFSIPIAMAGAAAAKAYQQIEEGSVKIRRVYGDMNTTAQETDAMVGKIQNLAAAYTKYGVAVADTMKMAADAAAMGKTGADLLAQIDQATKLSVLGGVDQQQALQTTISLTNAFGISTTQLSDKINYLNSVENQTSLSIEDMTTAIPKAAPIVKQLGGSVEDLAYFLTAMKEGGVNAAEGANAIKSGMASLINPTKAASDFLKGFGIDVAGIVQKDKGNLKQTVLDFAKSLDTLDPLNRAKAIEMMFGKFQFSRMSTMLQNITKEGSQASKAMELANMSAIERAAMSRKELDKIQSSPMYKFQKALADFQLKLAPVGEAFLKAITPVVETIGKALTFFNKLSESSKGFIVKTIAIVGGLAPVILMTVGLVGNGIANIMKFLSWIKAAFNKATTASQVLGETTDYMTQEQLKAASVAASLDQIHSKLRQTFTSEATAVEAYTAALKAANTAAGQFVGPVMPFRGGAKKFATGGMVVGPGGPKDDAIPANLSNGEAVIDAATVRKNPAVISALFQGRKINVPGFANNNSGMFPAYTNAVALLGKDTNQALKGSGVSAKDLSAEIRSLGAGMNAPIIEAVARSLGATNNKEVIAMLQSNPELRKFATDVQLGVADAVAKQNGKIDDPKLSAIYQKVARQESAKRGKGYAAATEQFLTQPTTFEDTTTQRVRSSGRVMSVGRAKLFKDVVSYRSKDFAPIARELGTDPTGLVKAHMSDRVFVNLRDAAVKYGQELSTQASAAAERMANGIKAMSQTMVDGVKKATRQASPSKDAYDAGANIGKGAINGIKAEEADAKDAGVQVAKAVVAGASQSRAATATAVRSGYVRDSELRDLTIRRKQAAMMGAETAAIDQEIKARKAAIASSVKERLAKERLASAEVQETQAAVQSGTVKKVMTVGEGLSKLNGKFALFSTGLTTASFALSQLPGPLGQIAQALTPIVGLLSVFGSVLDMVGMRGAAAAGGSGGFLSKLLGSPLTKLNWVILAVTAAFGIFSAITTAVNDARKKELEDINRYSNTLKNASGAVTELGQLSGITPNTSMLSNSQAASKVGVSGKAANDVSILLKSQEFTDPKSKISGMIEGIKGMSDGAATQFLASYANKLKGYGFDEKTIDSILRAIQIKANKTNLKLNFASVDITTSKGRTELSQQTQSDIAAGTNNYQNYASQKATNAQAVIDAKAELARQKRALATAIEANKNNPTFDKSELVTNVSTAELNLKRAKQAQKDINKDPRFKKMFTNVKTGSQNLLSNLESLNSRKASGDINKNVFVQSLKAISSELTKAKRGTAEYNSSNLILQQSFSGFSDPIKKAAGSFGKLGGQFDSLQTKYMLLEVASANGTLGNSLSEELNKVVQSGGNVDVVLQKIIKAYNGLSGVGAIKDYVPDTSGSGGGGGGSTKTDLIQQLKDAQNQSRARTALMNDNKKHVSGFIDLLATADDATRKVYMHIDKNGKVVLTGAGKKLEALFNASTVSNFVSKQKFAIKGFGEEAKARVFLSSKIKDQTVLTKMMEDADFKAAIASAMNIKDKKERTKALNDLIAVEQKYLKIQQSNADAALTEADKQQKRVDYLQAVLDKKTAESMMPVLQDKIDVYNDALNVLSVQEDEINKAYETRVTALDKIAQANQAIAQSQQDQLSVAEAITKGDMGAAAKAVQTMRANAAQKAMEDQKSALETAKEAQLKSLVVEVNGEKLTREEIEKRISGIQSTIYNIQLNQLDVIKSQIVEATRLQTILSANQTISDNASYAPKVTPPPPAVTSTSDAARAALIKLQSGGTAALTDEEKKLLNIAPSSTGGSSSTTSKPLIQAPAGLQFLPKDELAKMGYYASGGFARGSDTIPAMLTPGEFIMSRGAVAKYGSGLMDKINAGTFDMPSYSVAPQISQVSPVSNTISSNVDNSSVYNNSYSVNIHTTGTQDTDSIARAVIGKIREYDSQRVRGVRV